MEIRNRNRRVLIVEPEEEIADRVAVRALKLGLEPVVCPGVSHNFECPVLKGRECTKNNRCGAVLVSLDGDPQARVAPGCAGDAALVIARSRIGRPARMVVADRHVEGPYDPDHMALVLFALADSAVSPRRRIPRPAQPRG